MTFDQGVINILDEICSKFGIAVDWSMNSVLPYIQDLIEKVSRYKIVSYSVWLVILSIIVTLAVISIKKYYSEEELIIFPIIIIIIAVIAIAILGTCIAKAIFLPEMVFMEYVSYYLQSLV